MNQWRTCACVLGALLLTGCTAAGAAEHVASHATGHPPARATGHVTGKLLIEENAGNGASNSSESENCHFEPDILAHRKKIPF